MGINYKFNDINEINKFLSDFNEKDWAEKDMYGRRVITPDVIQNFITTNLSVISNGRDEELQSRLMTAKSY